jgi:hypothetical protein
MLVRAESNPSFHSARRTNMTLLVIGSFAVIFLSSILWATSRRADEHHH